MCNKVQNLLLYLMKEDLKGKKVTQTARTTSHIYLIGDPSKSHFISFIMTKINNFAAFSQPTLTKNNTQKTFNLKLPLKLVLRGLEISVQHTEVALTQQFCRW